MRKKKFRDENIEKLKASIRSNDENAIKSADPQIMGEILSEVLKSKDWKVFFFAFMSIEIPSNLTVTITTELLKSRQILLVVEAINALVRWKYSDALSEIVNCYSHRNELVRQAVVEAIWDLEAKEYRSVMATLVRDASPLVRAWAIMAFYNLFPEDCPKFLLKALEREHSRYVKTAIFGGLVFSGRKDFLKAFVDSINSKRLGTKYFFLNGLDEVLPMLDDEDKLKIRIKLREHVRSEQDQPLRNAIEKKILELT